MAFARLHPCNRLAWLYVEATAARQAMDKQLSLRDEALATDRHHSGEPAGFEAWSVQQVRAMAHQRSIAQQIEARQQELQQRLASREQAMAAQLAAFEAETDQIKADLKLLRSITAKVACQ